MCPPIIGFNSNHYLHNTCVSAFDSLSLTAIRELSIRSFRTGQGSRPDVLLVEKDGEKAVLKDHNACDPVFGFVLGRLLVWRETKALKTLRGTNGIPDLIKRADRRALLMTYAPALPVKQRRDEVDWETYFPRLSNLVERMHAQGVAHCDLRSPNNVLVDESDNPYLVDFVACVFRGAEWNPLSRWLFKRFCQVDRSAIAKLKKRYAPELLNDVEKELLQSESLLERSARNFGVGVRHISRLLFTSKSS